MRSQDATRREIVAATDLPVNADFESGYAHDPEGLARNVAACLGTGVAGLSIEDATGNPDRPLYEITEGVERIRAARAAIDASGADVVLTGRAECYLTGHAEPLPEAIRRLQAYVEAGADVVYAPGPKRREEIRTLVDALAPVPVTGDVRRCRRSCGSPACGPAPGTPSPPGARHRRTRGP